MDNGDMSASFMSICIKAYGGADRSDIGALLESRVGGAAPGRETENSRCDGWFGQVTGQCARESFAALVSAGTCANSGGTDILEGYATLARPEVLLGWYAE